MSTSIQTATSSFLQDALDKLHALGITPSENETPPIVHVLEKIAGQNNARAVLIARTLASQEFFDQVVSDQIATIQFSDRQNKIAKNFTSIREDAQRFVSQAEKNNVTFNDRVSNVVMKLTRGDISDRFNKIRSTQIQINKDVSHQLRVESIILEAYRDFRNGLKFAEVQSLELEKEIQKKADEAEIKYKKTQDVLEALHSNDHKAIKETAFKEKLANTERMDPNTPMTGIGASQKHESVQAQYELNRDIAYEDMNIAYQHQRIAERLTQNIQTAYAVTTVTMAKLVQFHDAKQKVYDESVTFMSTSGSILSALRATYTGLMGLHEATAALDTMQSEISKSMEALAGLGDKVTENAMRKVNGPIIDASAVKAVVESIVSYQTKNEQISKEMRKESAENIAEIQQIIETGKRNIRDLIEQEKIASL